MLNTPFQLGTLPIPNRVLLAPLAGVSDAPFRRICQDFGAGLTYIEMLSAAGMPHDNRKSGELIYRDPAEVRLGAQMTGPDPDILVRGAELLMKKNLPVDTLDLNMGCPVRKVVGRGCGSALVRNPELAGEMVRRVREVMPIPVSAKIRIGYNRSELTVEPVCRALALAGVEMLIIHGRTRDDGYSDPVRYDAIRAGFEATDAAAAGRRIWKIGNGNIFDLESARRMVTETGCDGVLVSRGSLGNPWIFRQILEDQDRQPTLGEWREVVLRHLGYHRAFYGEGHYAAIRFRKHLLWYVSGFPGSRALRPEMCLLESPREIEARILTFVDSLPAELPRFAEPAERNALMAADPKHEMDRQHDRGVEHYEEEA